MVVAPRAAAAAADSSLRQRSSPPDKRTLVGRNEANIAKRLLTNNTEIDNATDNAGLGMFLKNRHGR